MGTGHVPSQKARAARFREICEWFIREVLGALAEHLSERGIRGDKTIKEFEKTAREFVHEAFENNWRFGYAGGEEDKLFLSLANEVVENKIAHLRSLSPKRGRPPTVPTGETIGEAKGGRIEKKVLSGMLIGRAERLPKPYWTRERVAAICEVDPKTLRAAMRGKAVTLSKADRIERGIASAEQERPA